MKTFKLDNTPKINSGFIAPDKYFDDLPSKVINQLPNANPKVISLPWYKEKKIIGIAASIIITLSVAIFWYYQTTTNTIASENIENYLAYQSNITQYELINELSYTDLNALNETIPLNNTDLEEHLLKGSDIEYLIIE